MILRVSAVYNIIKITKAKFDQRKNTIMIKRRIAFSCIRIAKFLRRDFRKTGSSLEKRMCRKIQSTFAAKHQF